MKNVILCEGSTDYVLLQYFMRKAYFWKDDREQPDFRRRFGNARVLKKGEKEISIVGCNGCSNLVPALDFFIKYNMVGESEEIFEKIVIVTDRDEVGTEDEFIEKIVNTLQNKNVKYSAQQMKNNEWINCSVTNFMGDQLKFEILLLVIPFEQTGALETFLLSSIANSDEYDKKIIERCEDFVEHVDERGKYLNKRRYITKAKFDVYFSVRTPVQQYMERQNILKNVEWEKYIDIQECFRKLGDV